MTGLHRILRCGKAVGSLTAFLLVLLGALAAHCGQKITSPLRADNSDWWSNLADYGKTDLSATQTHTQHRELEPSTLEVATIKVGSGEIDKAATKLGKTTVVRRGDAGTSRTQACYISDDSDMYLIFEEDGEGFGASFYLFRDGPAWNGSSLCARSPLVSQGFSTASGLQLGLTATQVEAVLGKPSTAFPDKLVYSFEVKRRTSASELKRLRAQSPSLSEKDFHESFDFYYVDSSVVAKFTASKLTYLGVTQSETYP